MPPKRDFKLIGRGVYTIAETARLAKVSVSQVQRWTKGHWYRYRGERRFSPPIIGTGVEKGEGSPSLQFQDLMEIRFLRAFRQYGVSWRVIRLAAGRVQELLGRTHPFATRVFRTDGRTILAELVSDEFHNDERFLDLVSDQLEWEHFVRPHLLPEEIEFYENDEPGRWWPLKRDREVVVDPARSFGAPIVHREGVLTYLLAKAVGLEGDARLVAHWYDVSPRAVADAVEFETRFLAAA